MTLKQIRSQRPEVAKLVMARYPRNKKERTGCQTEIAKREYMRWMMAKRLMESPEVSKVEYNIKIDKDSANSAISTDQPQV